MDSERKREEEERLEELIREKRDARRAVARDADAVKEKAKDPLGFKAFVRERPLASVGIAAGTGLAAAWLLRGRGGGRRRGRGEDDDTADDAAHFGLGAALGLAFRSFVLPRLTRAAKDAAVRAVKPHEGNGHARSSDAEGAATPPWFR